MKPLHRAVLGNLASVLGLSTIMTVPGWAQTLAPGSSSAPAAPDGGAGGAVVAVVILALLVGIGVTVKLYDVKRKHEDEVAALQGRISDALLMDQSLSGLALTPSIQAPFRRSGLLTVVVTGLVPTPELREAAIQLVMRKMEESRTSFRVEDRVVVDPMMSRRAA
jgi:hypothetical protein